MLVSFSENMINLSLPFNDSLLQPNYPFSEIACYFYGRSSIIYVASRIIYIFLLLPLCIFILYQGLQKWRQNPYFSSTSMSHCDCFIYNFVIMELIGVVGCIIICFGAFITNINVFKIGTYIYFSKWYGAILFHVLTCLERYIAVVHPITFLNLRNRLGIRIRNITVACVWLISFVGLSLFYTEDIIYWELCFILLALVVISFCSVSVLCVLVNPGPGEKGEERKKLDQSKQRAFITIVSSLVVLMLTFSFNIILEVAYVSSGNINCVFLACVFWVQLLNCLVLPIFFLYKERNR